MKKFIIIAFALLFSISIISCNTIEGVGRDIQGVGRGLKKATD